MGKISKVFSLLMILLGGILVLAWAGTGYAIGLYGEGIEENCDSSVGTLAQITDWDDGRCDDAREDKEALERYRPLAGVAGSLFVGLGLIVLFRT